MSTRPERKKPVNGNKLQLCEKIHEKACSFSTCATPSPVYDIQTDNFDASAEHGYSLDYESLYQDVTDLKAQVESHQDENNVKESSSLYIN